jgi:hypothetical protein
MLSFGLGASHGLHVAVSEASEHSKLHCQFSFWAGNQYASLCSLRLSSREYGSVISAEVESDTSES